MSYQGKTAIVTGGASGIGLGITKHLAQQGANVVIADLNAVSGAKVIDELTSSGDLSGKVEFCACDVTSWASVCEVFEFAYLKFGKRIDFVFANAGISQMSEMNSSDPTHFSTSTPPSDLSTLVDRPPPIKVIRVNLDGVLYVVHAALAYFRSQEKDDKGWRGKIVCTGSNASFYPFPNDALYGASKHAVLGLCKSMGPKIFDEGITINCFGPSVVATNLAPKDFIERLERENRITPMSTVLSAVDFFINPDSKVTGQMVENCGEKNVIRKRPEYLDSAAEANMNEFSPVEVIRRTMNVEDIGLDAI
ncbi:SDR family NAD(P)-dependent oxidoreductase [Sporobolomyces salmoneus]|uniref:SDR family NAD(P)-dependent oxidoreductase n=1 Tax=Sporobolomyces salmoneus TaxID=183962 RepID=UPI00317A9E80